MIYKENFNSICGRVPVRNMTVKLTQAHMTAN